MVLFRLLAIFLTFTFSHLVDAESLGSPTEQSAQFIVVNISASVKGFATPRIFDVHLSSQAPAQETPAGAYTIALLSASNEVLYRTTFSFNVNIPISPILPGEVPSREFQVVRQSSVVVHLPWIAGAANIVLYDSALEIDRASVASARAPIAASVSSLEDGLLDLVFVSSGYLKGEKNKFMDDADRFLAEIFAYQPFRKYRSRIRTRSLWNLEELRCITDEAIPRVLVCDPQKVKQRVDRESIPYDKLFVIVNRQGYGGSGGDVGVAYNGELGPRVFVHEFGHSLGGLYDEYLLFLENGTEFNVPLKNCLAGRPPTSQWEGRVSLSDYRPVCAHPNWYASSQSSVMLSLDSLEFNVVSRDILSEEIEFYAASKAPHRPADVFVRRLGPTRASISWRDRSNNERGFLVYRSRRIHFRWQTPVLIASLPRNITSIKDVDVGNNGDYRYRVVATNRVGAKKSRWVRLPAR